MHVAPIIYNRLIDRKSLAHKYFKVSYISVFLISDTVATFCNECKWHYSKLSRYLLSFHKDYVSRNNILIS